jgi:membrane associated rhomboid family serine protease
MFFPIGDTPNPRGIPFATYALIAINVAVFVLVTVPLSGMRPDLNDPSVAEYLRIITPHLGGRVPVEDFVQQLTAYDLYVFAHGFRPAHPSAQDLLYSLFLHANFAHLFGNMLFLWIYGDNVEQRLGPMRYLLAYVGTGIAASLFHALTSMGSDIPSIGASGAISGVLGCYFVWFPRNAVRVMLFFPLMSVMMIPARVVLGLYLVADNLLPFLLSNRGTGVAYGAHLGGFFAGLALAWWSNRREVLATPRDYAGGEPVVSLHGGEPARVIADEIAGGRFEDAARNYFALARGGAHGALDSDDALKLADWLRRNGHVEAALTVLRRLLRDRPRDGRAADAHVGAGYVLLEDLGQPAAAYQHFRDALELEPDGDTATLARAGIATIQAQQKRQWGRPYAAGRGY